MSASARSGASGSAKGRLEPPPAGVEPTTSERCSDRESVPDRAPLGPRPSRCSHDLFPHRGLPIQSLGLRPPLMCLLPHRPSRPKTRRPVASRHFRVSIRLGLGATPKTGSNLLEVCNLFRSPETLRQPPANRRLPSRGLPRKRDLPQRAPGLSLFVKGFHSPK
jgi:hypothetical protein